MCEPDLEKLRSWQPPAGLQNESTADYLTIPQGKEDMQLLAKRLQSYFPELLRIDPNSINSQTYKVIKFEYIYFFMELSHFFLSFSLERPRLSVQCLV